MKLVLEAKYIPLDSKVSKLTGHKQYCLYDKINIYDSDGLSQIIKSDDTSRFLIDTSNSISTVSGETKLVCHMSLEDLEEYLYENYH